MEGWEERDFHTGKLRHKGPIEERSDAIRAGWSGNDNRTSIYIKP